MPVQQRLRYLNWRICELEKQHRAYVEAQIAVGHDLVLFEAVPKLDNLRRQWRLEQYDLEPLPVYQIGRENYHNYLDSCRWKRKRLLKFVTVNWSCEYSGCSQPDHECHHLHYETVGFETNADLEALCSRHHRARHSI
jgi:hypothetical protein